MQVSRSNTCVLLGGMFALALSGAGLLVAAETPATATEALTPASAADAAPQQQLAVLEREYAEHRQQFRQRIEKAQTDADRKQILADMRTLQTDFNSRFLAVAASDPGSATALQALSWILVNDFQGSPQSVEALEVIARHHIANDQAAEICQRLVAWTASADTEKFLRAAIDSPNRRVQGYGRYCLAMSLRSQSERASEAESLLSEVAVGYADVPGFRGTLADAATAALFEIRHLNVGSTAPEIEGQDVNGQPMKLSDFRGQVVLLSFWGSWCVRCLDSVPHERQLVERMKGQPFALLGVASDSDPQLTRSFMNEQKMTWKSWYDGDMTSGPIAASWNVLEWPMFYLLDHEGVIRAKFQGPLPTRIDDAIEPLVARAAGGIGKQRAWLWLFGGGLVCILVAVVRLWTNHVPGPARI